MKKSIALLMGGIAPTGAKMEPAQCIQKLTPLMNVMISLSSGILEMITW